MQFPSDLASYQGSTTNDLGKDIDPKNILIQKINESKGMGTGNKVVEEVYLSDYK